MPLDLKAIRADVADRSDRGLSPGGVSLIDTDKLLTILDRAIAAETVVARTSNARNVGDDTHDAFRGAYSVYPYRDALAAYLTTEDS